MWRIESTTTQICVDNIKLPMVATQKKRQEKNMPLRRIERRSQGPQPRILYGQQVSCVAKRSARRTCFAQAFLKRLYPLDYRGLFVFAGGLLSPPSF